MTPPSTFRSRRQPGRALPRPTDLFDGVPPPRIIGVTLSSGPLAGGKAITVTGADVAYGTQRMIADNPVPFSYNSDGPTSAATAPGEAYEAVPVALTTVGGANVGGSARTV